jgi:hypothetical protein
VGFYSIRANLFVSKERIHVNIHNINEAGSVKSFVEEKISSTVNS